MKAGQAVDGVAKAAEPKDNDDFVVGCGEGVQNLILSTQGLHGPTLGFRGDGERPCPGQADSIAFNPVRDRAVGVHGAGRDGQGSSWTIPTSGQRGRRRPVIDISTERPSLD